jgi:hypothetical protein
LDLIKVYVDDSAVGVEPISVLAGWAAPAYVWSSFEKEWSDALGMSPKLRYFKESEASSRSGEFSGWSDQSFNDRMHRLTRIIADHQLFGVISAIPTKLYADVFGQNPDKILRHPYFFMINDLVSRMSLYLGQIGFKGKVQFIFDEQKGQQEAVSQSWARLLEAAPDHVKPIIAEYPIFRSDATVMALQAADFNAGHMRRDLIDFTNGRERPDAPWIAKMDKILCLGKLWDENLLRELAAATPKFAAYMRF